MTADPVLAAARAGDARSFDAMVAPYRRALVAHCYRLLGSPADAEDVVQDALLRAWKGLNGYDGRGSLRGWLYQVATNVCLTEIERRPRRKTVDELGPPAAQPGPPGEPLTEVAWLEPCAPELWADSPGPEARYSARESVGIAFLTLLQLLPAQQRAVLLFRDVLGWSAAETADALETTVAAANSTLQRARATMERWRETAITQRYDEGQVGALLKRYVQAWESGDATALAALLHDDAKLTMPPVSLWFQGRANIERFLSGLIPSFGAMRLRVFEANGGPAAAAYVQRPGESVFRAQSLQILSLAADGSIGRIDVFMNPEAFTKFGLPLEV